MTATTQNPAPAQLTLDFSRAARASNVIQLVDYRKVPTKLEEAAELRENCIALFGREAKGMLWVEYMIGLVAATQAAVREGRSVGSAASEYRASSAAEELHARFKNEGA